MIKNDRFFPPPPPPPITEHGFSSLISAVCYDKSGVENKSKTCKDIKILFDCGTSENDVVHNAGILGINFESINFILLSHGHFDHFTGLLSIIKRVVKPIRMI